MQDTLRERWSRALDRVPVNAACVSMLLLLATGHLSWTQCEDRAIRHRLDEGLPVTYGELSVARDECRQKAVDPTQAAIVHEQRQALHRL
jgi:hypothetical protein